MADRRILELNGTAFENMIIRYLTRVYPDCVILPNLELYSPKLGQITQIDVTMVKADGVTVIEAKNWKNLIRGEYDDPKWVGRGSSANLIDTYSPFGQNILHIRALRNAIRVKYGVDVPTFNNIICVPDGVPIESHCNEICNVSMLETLVNFYTLRHQSEIDVSKMVEMIQGVCK